MENMRIILLATVVSAAWCFNGWLGYLSTNTKESTQRVLSLDKKEIEMAKVRQCSIQIQPRKLGQGEK